LEFENSILFSIFEYLDQKRNFQVRIIENIKNQMARMFKLNSTLILLALLPCLNLNAQGYTTPVEGHHLVGVNLTTISPTQLSLNYAIENKYSSFNIPGYLEPYYENNSVMKGIMSEAALAIDWWVLFGEPAEQYIFSWAARDYYELQIPAPSGGGTIVKRVIQSNLNKYPDLLLRYESLKPTEVAFEIVWSFAVTDGEILDQTGYSFISYYNTQNKFKTIVSSAGILTEPSGKIPLSVPGIRQGKGEAFLGLPNDFPEEKVKALMQLFAKSKKFYIESVNITKINWPIDEMRAIADLYDKYEKGEADPSPKQLIANAEEQNKYLSTYGGTDFWGDAFADEKVNISLETVGSEYILKNNNLTTFKTNQYNLNLFWREKGYYSPNTESKYLVMWGSTYDNFRQGYKHDISTYPYHIIDYKGTIISIDGKTKFIMVNYIKNEQGLYEAVYFTDEWTYIRDICYTAGGGGYNLGQIHINSSFDEAKTKLLNHVDSESGCANGRGYSKYGVGKFISYYLNDQMQVIQKKTEYRVLAVYNY